MGMVQGHSHGYGAETWAGWKDIVMGMVHGHGQGGGT